MSDPFRVGVDIGGTFTDLLAMDERSRRTFVQDGVSGAAIRCASDTVPEAATIPWRSGS
jgi:N-methylhydantoinase A/oxoprolinase/acetone carboxylase beta subunit